MQFAVRHLHRAAGLAVGERHAFEQVQSFTDDTLTSCPECTGRLRKVFNAVGVVFKGSGFYRNDSRKADTSSTAPSGNSGLLTLEVPPVAAQMVASIPAESLYLTLVPQDYTPTPLPKLPPFPSQLPGEDPSNLTPYGPQGLQTKK